MQKEANPRVFSVFFHPNTNVTAVGGAEKRFVETSKFFVKKGLRMVVLESSPSLLNEKRVFCRVYTQRSLFSAVDGWLTIYLDWVLWTLLACFRSVSLIRRERCSLILAPNNTVPNLLPAYFAHLVTHLPFCVVAHHMDFLSEKVSSNFGLVYTAYRMTGYSWFVSFLKALAFFVIIRILKKSDAYIAVSNFTAQTLMQLGIAPGRISVSGNGVDLDFIDQFETPIEKRYDAVFVGRISKEKGIFDLLDSWRDVSERDDAARLLMIGSGPDLRKVKEALKKSRLRDNVIARGRVDDAKMYALMKASKVFVFPSRYEGWGLAVAEALACGLPVVCYDIPALREVFGDCRSVFLVSLDDVRKFSATIIEILEMKKEEYNRLASISRSYVRRFAWSEVASKDLRAIRRQLKQKEIPRIKPNPGTEVMRTQIPNN